MKLRCPYCRQILEKAAALCPHCKKTMAIPDNFIQLTPSQKKEILSDIDRKARLERMELGQTDMLSGTRMMRAGFGLVLLLIAGGLLAGKLMTTSTSAGLPGGAIKRLEKAQRELDTLYIALHMFKTNYARFPTTEEGLKALVINPGLTNWTKNIVTEVHPDPWKRPYIYRSTNDSFILYSRGLDGKDGTDDDLAPTILQFGSDTNTPPETEPEKPDKDLD
jgi:general secretion pathway protein G